MRVHGLLSPCTKPALIKQEELLQLLDVPGTNFYIYTESELCDLEDKLSSIDDRHWIPNAKGIWLRYSLRLRSHLRVGLILVGHVSHELGLLHEGSVWFIRASADGSRGMKIVTLPGPANGFPFHTLKGGYLLCIQEKGQTVHREQVGTLAELERVLESHGNPSEFIYKHSLELFPEDTAHLAPSQFDVLLQDLGETDIKLGMPSALGVRYLAPETKEDNTRKAITGKLYGPFRRPIVNLVMKLENSGCPANIIFIVDTGSPYLFLCGEAFKAMGIKRAIGIDERVSVKFGGKVHVAYRSHGHFEDFNLLGAEFLETTNAVLTVDYFDAENMVKADAEDTSSGKAKTRLNVKLEFRPLN